jgi:c(7)-type cytochrome triheme protein
MEAGTARVTMSQMADGAACGACHRDQGEAFGMVQCNRCHYEIEESSGVGD